MCFWLNVTPILGTGSWKSCEGRTQCCCVIISASFLSLSFSGGGSWSVVVEGISQVIPGRRQRRRHFHTQNEPHFSSFFFSGRDQRSRSIAFPVRVERGIWPLRRRRKGTLLETNEKELPEVDSEQGREAQMRQILLEKSFCSPRTCQYLQGFLRALLGNTAKEPSICKCLSYRALVRLVPDARRQ